MANRQRDFWDRAAKANAAFYVDTTVSYDNPDMDAFFATGRQIVDEALAPVRPVGRGLAVEIGSGLGRNCVALAEHFDRVIGVDIAPEMIRQAPELVSDERVSFLLTEGATLPSIQDGVGRLRAVVHRLPAHSRHRSHRGVRSRGRARVATRRRLRIPVEQPELRAGMETAARGTRRRGRSLVCARDPHHRNAVSFSDQLSMDRMRRTLARAGLDVEKTAGEGTLFCWAWAVKGGSMKRVARLIKLCVPLVLLGVVGRPTSTTRSRIGALAGLVGLWSYVYARYRSTALRVTANEREMLRTANWETYSRHYNEQVPTIEEEFDIWGEYHQHRHEMRYDKLAIAADRRVPRRWRRVGSRVRVGTRRRPHRRGDT